MQKTDFLIIGGGVIGVNIAAELRRRYGDCSITLVEKEPEFGLHASGRNSGVIHAGFYYTADSLKAKFTRDGNIQLHAYCEQRGIPVNRCGKLVVAKDAGELKGLDELLARGKRNGVPLQAVTADEARQIEPRCKTHERALFSPTTSSADPRRVLAEMLKEAREAGVNAIGSARYLGRRGSVVQTTQGEWDAGYVVNAAGLYADSVARDFGFSQHYRIVPFKGLYVYCDEPVGAFRTHIYPVPDLRNPFLGVHFTLTVDGHAKIGPTAIPAAWREQYHGLDGFRPAEALDIGRRLLSLFFRAGFDFRRLAFEEMQKYSLKKMIALASELATGLEASNFTRWGKPGIRAQLLDVRSAKLVMDFLLEGDERSMHVLNAVSPGWTCSIPFSSYVCDQIQSKLGEPGASKRDALAARVPQAVGA